MKKLDSAYEKARAIECTITEIETLLFGAKWIAAQAAKEDGDQAVESLRASKEKLEQAYGYMGQAIELLEAE